MPPSVHMCSVVGLDLLLALVWGGWSLSNFWLLLVLLPEADGQQRVVRCEGGRLSLGIKWRGRGLVRPVVGQCWK